MGLTLTPGPTKRYIKTVVLIDGEFLENVVRDSFQGKVLHLRPFLPKIASAFDADLEISDSIRTYYYDAVHEVPSDDPNFEEKRRKKIALLNYLEENCPKVEVKRGFLRFPADPEEGLEQKGVDALLSSDMALIAWMGKVERIILVAADGDYVPAVEVAKRAMTNVYLLSDKKKLSPHLKRTVDIWKLNLADLMSELGVHDPKTIAEAGVIPTELINDKALGGKS
jgi:uncharacterized LabA/DUF88 family protein